MGHIHTLVLTRIWVARLMTIMINHDIWPLALHVLHVLMTSCFMCLVGWLLGHVGYWLVEFWCTHSLELAPLINSTKIGQNVAHNGTEKRVFRPQCSFDVTAQI